MKRILLSLSIAISTIVLAATVFSQSIFIGPLLITFSLISVVYSLVCLYQFKKTSTEILLEFIFHLFMWP